MESFTTPVSIISITGSITAARPFGASFVTSWVLYHFDVPKINQRRMALLIIIARTSLVMEMSKGLISSPAALVSTTLPASEICSPSYSAPSSSLLDEKTCQPVLLLTMTGRGIDIALSPILVICHSYASLVCPNITS